MAIHLTTLGGLRIDLDGVEQDRLLGQRLRAALFVYLAVERRVSRDSLLTVFWPESSGENARHALRQSLYHLRNALGPECLEAGLQELRVSGGVHVDAQAFDAALASGDRAAAARLYAGPFLAGVNLVDLPSWESWVDSRRMRYARGFRKACRTLVESRRMAGELAGVIEAAQRWVAPDPWDDEAQHQLIRALADAGERTEAIRQYEGYLRLLEPEGLRPLDATIELMERVRNATAARSVFEPAANPRPTSDPAAVAVFPFSVHGGEEVHYLGEGMVNLLGAALDGAGSVRPVDARAVFSAVARLGSRAPDPESGSPLATRLGAALFVLGDVVRAGDRLHIEAAIYGADAASDPLSRAAVNGDADGVLDLVDTLAARLLAGLGDPAADRLLRTAAVKTASLPAFKAYLEGERQMRAGRFERAAEAHLEATTLDPSYAVAHYRLALAREWAPMRGQEEAAREAVRYAARLAPRDRALLEAYETWRAGDAVEAERLYRAILARYPDDVEAWLQLAEILFHFGPLLGRPFEGSEPAWRRALYYEPCNLFALPHLARIAAASGRVDALDALLAPFAPDEVLTDRRLLEIGLLRALAARDTAATHALVEEVRRCEDLAAWRLAAWVVAFSPDPAAVRPVIHELNEDHRSPGTRADLLWFLSVLHLASGQLAAARELLTEAVAVEATAPAERRRAAFAQVTEWFTATLPLPYADSTLECARRSAASAGRDSPEAIGGFQNDLGLGRPIRFEPLRQYVVGLLSLRLEDPTAAVATAAALARFAASPEANPLVRDLDRGLRARIAWHDGRLEEALRLLQCLEFGDSQGDLAVVPFVSRANERLLRAEVLAALGRGTEALSWLASLGKGSVCEIPFAAPCHLRRAELHERLGNPLEAAGHYARFAELWSDSDPELRPLVTTAFRRAAELTRAAGPAPVGVDAPPR